MKNEFHLYLNPEVGWQPLYILAEDGVKQRSGAGVEQWE